MLRSVVFLLGFHSLKRCPFRGLPVYKELMDVILKMNCYLIHRTCVRTHLELHGPIPLNSVESDLGCASRIFFDNVTLALYNVTLTL